MRRISMIPLPDHTGNKRIIILLGMLLAAAIPFIALMHPYGVRVLLIAAAGILMGLLTYTWAYFDSMEVAEQLQPLMGISLIFFSLITLFVYLFHSRGLRHGSRAAGKTLLLLAAMSLISASVFNVLDIPLR